ncbi:porimin isoform 1-T1 [Morus bassanus]
MRLLSGASCALQVAAVLLLLAPGSRNKEMNNSTSTTPFTMIPDHKLQDNSSSSNLTVTSSTQSTAPSTVGMSTSTIHLTSTSQPTNTTSVTLMTQPTKTSQTTRSTTASSVTSSQFNITVVTTSKTSFTSVTAISKSEAVIAKTSRFDVGSFIGGIVLTLGVLVILYIGCKTYHSRRGIQYRTIDEHDAII